MRDGSQVLINSGPSLCHSATRVPATLIGLITHRLGGDDIERFMADAKIPSEGCEPMSVA